MICFVPFLKLFIVSYSANCLCRFQGQFYCCLLRLWRLSVKGGVTIFYSTEHFSGGKNTAQVSTMQALIKASARQWHSFNLCALPAVFTVDIRGLLRWSLLSAFILKQRSWVTLIQKLQ